MGWESAIKAKMVAKYGWAKGEWVGLMEEVAFRTHDLRHLRHQKCHRARGDGGSVCDTTQHTDALESNEQPKRRGNSREILALLWEILARLGESGRGGWVVSGWWRIVWLRGWPSRGRERCVVRERLTTGMGRALPTISR